MVPLGRTLVPIWVVLFLSVSPAFPDSPPFDPVSGFDVSRYLGKWYEIARMPSSFEKDWVNVTTTYSLREDGKLKVVNEGRRDTVDGKRVSASGKARFAGKDDVGYFRISFFWPVSFNYVILALDPEYTCAMVASSEYYFWILAREPNPDMNLVDGMIQKAREMGFDTDKLIFTTQEWGNMEPERPEAVIPR